MYKRLNWKIGKHLIKDGIPYLKGFLLVSLVLTIFANITYAQDTSKLRIKYKDANNQYYPYFKIGVGGVYPCGQFFSISLEDEARHIFSAASGFNVTLNPDPDELFMLDGVAFSTDGGKRALSYMSYQNSFDRVTNLKVGYIEGAFGEKWAAESDQLKTLYPKNVFDINYGDKPRTAFDQSNLFYEMLISIQVLAHKNEELTATVESQEQTMATFAERIERLENALNIQNQFIAKKTIGNVSINPNPNTDGNLLVDYQLNDTSKEVQLIMADMNGKIVHQTKLNQTEGNEQLTIDLPTGTYLYYLTNHTQQSNAQKLIIQ